VTSLAHTSVIAAALVLLVAPSCTREGDSSVAESVATPTRTASPRPSGDGTPASFDASAVELQMDVVAQGLESPLGITYPGDSSDRLFIVEQGGTVRVLDRGELLPEPFLDVSDLVVAGGEQGLLGLAFHPDYGNTGRFFIDYTDLAGDTVVAEYTVSEDPDVANPDSARVLLRIDQPFANHNGGNLMFGPDGYLYIGTGDGGSAGDPQENGQDLSTLLGKLLRIDVDGRAGDEAYGIPPDNPFVNEPDARPEIWAYGLRNPWRFSFDRQTGDLWIGDVGQSAFEEIDHTGRGIGGVNYGWDVMEGRDCFTEAHCDRDGLALPVTGYSHDEGCSVTGGFVYRGSNAPALDGGYVFGDYCSGSIWVLDAGAEGFVEPVQVASTSSFISSFGEDEDGELYMADLAGGEVVRLGTR
jgi:glucose/arabinose dehydrogenase